MKRFSATLLLSLSLSLVSAAAFTPDRALAAWEIPPPVQELSERITRPFYDAWNDAGKVFKRLSSEKQKKTQVATYTYLHGARYIEPPALLAAVAETVPDFLVKLRGVVQSWFLSDEPDDVSQTLSAQHLSLSPQFPEQNQNPESESEPEQGTLPPANAPNVTYITEPVIERIIENSAQGGVSETTLSARLQDLASTLNDRIQNAFLGAARSAVVQNVSDITVDGVTGLVDADIPDGITASNYLLLTGGTLTGSLTGTSLTLSGDLTVSGAQTLSGAITIPYLSATSTTASSFIQASTTRFSVFDTAYFGGSATSTFDSAGNLSVAGTLTATNGLSTLSNLLTTGSSTLQNFTFVNATGTSATSTNFAISGISSGSLLKTTTGGAVIAAVAGTDYAAASSVFAFPWSATTNYAAAANSTSTPIWFQQGLQASSTSQIAYASTTAITATTASTTNLIASNSFTLASLTGFLKATAGAVATSLIDLTSDITGILGVTNGGTGWGDIQANSIVLGNGAGALATTTAGTDGQVLALSNGVPTWTATTTFAGGLTYANGSVTLDWMFPSNATTTGLGLYASTTIGAGGQATGLTISGGATTTGNAYFAGNVGIKNKAPSYALDVAGFINTDQYSGYKQAGNTILYASTTNSSLAVGASGAAAWMAATSSPFYSTAIGYQALNTAPTVGTAGQNTALGYASLYSNTTGNSNAAIGTYSLYSNTTGYENIAIGTVSLYSNSTGNNNAAIGVQSLYSNTTGYNNIANGQSSLFTNTTGYENIAIGVHSLYYNASATSSTALGAYAGKGISLYNNQGGVYAGYKAGYSAGTDSDYNNLLGYQSGYGVTTGARNTLIGNSTIAASYNQVTTGSNNVSIGNDVAVPLTTASNQLSIGNLIYGTGLDGTGATVSSGKIGIGTTSPARLFSVHGAGYISSDLFVGGNIVSTSTTASIFPYASTTALTVSGSIDASGALLVNNATSTITNLVMLTSTSTNATSTHTHISTLLTGALARITDVVFTNATSTNATSTNQYISGQLTLASLTGPLQATGGAVSASSTLSVAYGGTGANTFATNGILYGSAKEALQVTAAGTGGNILMAGGSGVPGWVATSTLLTSLSLTKGNFLVGNNAGVAQATSTIFIDSVGRVGIGTTTPQKLLSLNSAASILRIQNTGELLGDSSMGDLEFFSQDGSAGRSGVFSKIRGIAIDDAGAGGSLNTFNGEGGGLAFYTSNDAIGSTLPVLAERMRINNIGNVGIGSTTPSRLLNPFSATAAQLSLSAGAGNAQWAFRNAGGNLYFATTTVAGTATTSTSALTIIGSSGNVGIGTTTPWRTLSVTGTMGISAPTNSNIGDYLCWNTVSKEVTENATACSLSSIRWKENIRELEYGLNEVMRLHPIRYDLKSQYGNAKDQPGFIAEEALTVVPDLVSLGDRK